jgi:hypothetical protein
MLLALLALTATGVEGERPVLLGVRRHGGRCQESR